MNAYMNKTATLVNDLIVLINQPNLAYVEAMSCLTETVMAGFDNQVSQEDMLYLYKLTLDSLQQLQDSLPSLKAKDGFAQTLQQLIDVHAELLAE